MDYSLSQELKLQQNLSPQMLQSLALLPMTYMELQAYVQKEIESNPALEIPESDIEQTYSDPRLLSESSDPEASDRKESFLENIANNNESLSEHLLKQLGETHTNSVTREIAELLIGNLDANGFYIISTDELFEGKHYSIEDINSTMELVRSFEPYGICVSNFRESLILQAKCAGLSAEDLNVFSNLVNNHLEDIQNSRFSLIEKKLSVTEEELLSFISILKSFTPFPGRLYCADNQVYVVPEFSIHAQNNTLVLSMNNSSLPVLEISSDFVSLSKQTKDKETNEYIRASIKQAKNLINQIEMRSKTMSKVAMALMELQKDFFFEGPKALKTLSLKEIANQVEVHESTVSRLSQNKYVETDFGIFPMKYFFTQGVATSEGSTLSRNAVKDMIADIVKQNPKLSAQKISDQLADKGITCARRTVAKYLAEIK